MYAHIYDLFYGFRFMVICYFGVIAFIDWEYKT